MRIVPLHLHLALDVVESQPPGVLKCALLGDDRKDQVCGQHVRAAEVAEPDVGDLALTPPSLIAAFWKIPGCSGRS